MTISSRGIKFTAEDASSMQATVFIQEHLCSAFAVDMKTVKEGFYFGLDLSVLIDCLNLYGSNTLHPTTVQMVLPPDGQKLALWYVQCIVRVLSCVFTLIGRVIYSHGTVLHRWHCFCGVNFPVLSNPNLVLRFPISLCAEASIPGYPYGH